MGMNAQLNPAPAEPAGHPEPVILMLVLHEVIRSVS